ncbi:hypothetical protein QPK32_21960 [Massilia sp. YIM B02763]|uniref:hypothetical protein n=1 Tax=Massilia sp. YIM B02763 TaxID=3050130 RepID=UPI0025B6FC4C|nr:hypothetical protein [Massilia sp. YIM B02763]MDN4055736.1 hypothetical protein [Massilia sp. YIM B02763]
MDSNGNETPAPPLAPGFFHAGPITSLFRMHQCRAVECTQQILNLYDGMAAELRARHPRLRVLVNAGKPDGAFTTLESVIVTA